jgi:VanZ family protein
MKPFFKYQWLTILWALFIFTMCSIKMGDVGKSSLFFPGFDKLVHCGFFFVIVVFSANGFLRQQKRSKLSYTAAAVITLLAIAFGGLIELLQLWVFTWRSGEWSDLFADTVGACMALFSILITIGAVKHDQK